jgi:putative redox protein
MATVKAHIATTNYQVSITTPAGHTILADEPTDLGGTDAGFTPTELLASSLAACTSITLRMYANRKGWDLQQVNVNINLQAGNASNPTSTFNREITLNGNLDEQQRERLLAVANACPVHKILTNTMLINTVLIAG